MHRSNRLFEIIQLLRAAGRHDSALAALGQAEMESPARA